MDETHYRMADGRIFKLADLERTADLTAKIEALQGSCDALIEVLCDMIDKSYGIPGDMHPSERDPTVRQMRAMVAGSRWHGQHGDRRLRYLMVIDLKGKTLAEGIQEALESYRKSRIENKHKDILS